MHVEGVARYLVTGGRDALIEPLGADAGGVGDFFPGTPFTALLQQRGVATLHAPAGAQGVAEGTLEPPAIPAKLEYAH